MSQSQYSGSKGFRATAALAKNVLVKLSSGNVVVATAATDKIIGVTEDTAQISEIVSVRLLSSGGTGKFTAGGNITAGDLLTGAAAGKVVTVTQASAGAQPTSVIVGRALEGAASGDIFEAELMTFVY